MRKIFQETFQIYLIIIFLDNRLCSNSQHGTYFEYLLQDQIWDAAVDVTIGPVDVLHKCGYLCHVKDGCTGFGFNRESEFCSLLKKPMSTETCDTESCTQSEGTKVYIMKREPEQSTTTTLIPNLFPTTAASDGDGLSIKCDIPNMVLQGMTAKVTELFQDVAEVKDVCITVAADSCYIDDTVQKFTFGGDEKAECTGMKLPGIRVLEVFVKDFTVTGLRVHCGELKEDHVTDGKEFTLVDSSDSYKTVTCEDKQVMATVKATRVGSSDTYLVEVECRQLQNPTEKANAGSITG